MPQRLKQYELHDKRTNENTDLEEGKGLLFPSTVRTETRNAEYIYFISLLPRYLQIP